MNTQTPTPELLRAVQQFCRKWNPELLALPEPDRTKKLTECARDMLNVVVVMEEVTRP